MAGWPDVADDAREYLLLARSLAAGTGFTLDGTTPYLYRPPLFAALLGAWFIATGTTSALSASVFSTLLHALAAPLAAALAARLGASRRNALLAGAFIAAYPYGFVNIGVPLQEWLLTPLLALAVLVAARLLERPSARRAALCGFVLGAATLAKAPNLILPALLLGTGRFLPVPPDIRLGARHVGILLLALVLVVGPWTLRNYAVTEGAFVPVNAQGTGVWLWAACDGDCGDLRESVAEIAEPERSPGKTAGFFQRGDPDGIRAVADANEAALAIGTSGHALETAREVAARGYVLAHPGRHAYKAARVSLLTFSPAARPETPLSSYALRIPVMALVHIPLFLVVVTSLVRGLRRRKAILVVAPGFLLLAAALYIITLTGEGRQLIPFLPIQAALAAAALSWKDQAPESSIPRTRS